VARCARYCCPPVSCADAGDEEKNLRPLRMGFLMQISSTSDYGDVRMVKVGFEDALSQIEMALKAEGFGVLCHIDIQAKMKEKLGIDFPRYVILGACNPPLAQQALQRDVNLGLLLPCNVVVFQKCLSDAAGETAILPHPQCALAQLRRSSAMLIPAPALCPRLGDDRSPRPRCRTFP